MEDNSLKDGRIEIQESKQKRISGRARILVFFIILGIAAMIWSITGIYQVFTKGHGAVANTSTYMPWGLQISAYAFLILVSIGCTFVNFFGHQINPKAYALIGPRLMVIAFLAVLGGMASIFFELGWPSRSIYWILTPNFDSPMAWMAYFFPIYIVFVVLQYIFLKKKPDSIFSKVTMWAAFISAVVTLSTHGTLFGVVEARPYYYGQLIPIFFLAVAFLSGVATASLVAYTSGAKYSVLLQPLKKMLCVGIAIVFMLSVWRFIIGISSTGEGYEIFEMTAPKFWIVSVFLASVVPFALAIISMSRAVGWLLPLAAIIVLVTQFYLRHFFIVDAFKLPLFKSSLTPEVITYSPSSVELSISAGAFMFVLTFYSIADLIGILEPKRFEEEVKQ
jgi:molybdopterin-containing oxidoreductase family membrane subunit